uniref:Odorant receptor n=1 Tax=Lobesia botrana TaxID=209534 RepID=A0A345BET6_9NEOP|nr:odorant receptors OR2.4 [Lobesia botrana]
MNRLRLIMQSLGSWPEKRYNNDRLFAGSKCNLLWIMASIVAITLALVFVLQNWHEITFFDLGHDILCILLTYWVLQRLILARTQKYQEMVRDYLYEFHLFYYKDQSQYSAKMYSLIHVISGIFTFYVICLMVTGMTLFNLKPWYNNYSRGMFSAHRPANSTFEHAVYLYSPGGFSYTNMKGYWILFIWNLPVSYFVTCGLCGFDLLVSTIIFQILGHLEILKYNLLSIPLPTDEGKDGMYSIEENIQIRKYLKENIVHHKLIINFVEKCSDALSKYLFLFYLIQQITSCILLLEISAMTSDALAKYGPLTCGLYQQLIQISVLFELVNTKSVQLIDSIYELPWECMDTSNRKTVLFMLLRAQTTLSLKAGKLVPVGVQTMAAILKTTISYYMMLRAVAGDR